MLERIFEKILWNCRFFTILPVIFGLIGSILMFVVASFDIIKVLIDVYSYIVLSNHSINLHTDAIAIIIGAIDLYLMALVFLIFSFGIYELFISEIDDMRNSSQAKVLEIRSLDALKDKIGKVIIMVLIVNFFQRALNANFSTPLEMGYLALSILALCLGIYFLHKGAH